MSTPRPPIDSLVQHLTGSGDDLRALLSDPRVLARLRPDELDHLAAALEAVMRAWSCVEYAAGIGPAVEGVRPLGAVRLSESCVH